MEKKSEKVRLSPPWDGHMSKLASFFKGDDRVRVGTCGMGYVANIEVFDTKMYSALEQVLNKRIRFGNVVLKINLVPANGVKAFKGEMTDLAALKVVLKDNPAFAKIVSRKTELGNNVFVLFKPVVLMWYNDNLASPYKQSTSVYELEAQIVFKDLGVSYSTEPQKGIKFFNKKGSK